MRGADRHRNLAVRERSGNVNDKDMIKFRNLIAMMLLVCSPAIMKGQEKEHTDSGRTDEVKLGVRAGHNVAFGGYGAVSLETSQAFGNSFAIRAGAQYSTFGKTSLEARPGYIIDFDWGRIVPEVLLAYTNLSSINSFAAGAGANGDFGRLSAKLGYYYHTFGGQGGWITEPFNIYYELSVHLLQKVENWKMNLTITNNEIFELERHYQPSFIAECFHYPTDKIGISFGIGCKPTGMFNMSADNYQTYLKTGVCYRW